MSKGKATPQGEAAEKIEKLLTLLPTATIAGSLRRGKEMVRDADVIVTEPVDIALLKKHRIHIMQAGEHKVRVKVGGAVRGFQVDIVVTNAEHKGAALLYLTGPRDFNLAMRSEAKSQGLKLNERGLWKMKGKKETLVAAKTEKEIFKALGLKFVWPSSRSAESLLSESDEGLTFKIPSNSDPTKTYDVVYKDGKPRCPCRGFAFSGSKKQKHRVPKGYSKWCDHCRQAEAKKKTLNQAA